MARSGAVWGIDVGQCALKALRCRATAAGDSIEGDAFDYIEYPKILSQPDANPTELIRDALKQFLSRNSVKGDSVAISVSGQAGLARFIKLPPVEAKKIPDIVRYEAKQQIPFDLNDVIWDYQRMGMGTVEEGFALETEIGLFAMKRDEVTRRLKPFQEVGIEIDFVQLTPLSLYNYLLFDQIRDLPAPDEYDPENPPESTVILSLGTDATDLVITNGYRVWNRSIPLGGSHFTKALTKEMKLTFAKAEHLKRNAMAAADPKAVFQAMKPVFGDLLGELQRSISYFGNLDRAAKIGRIVALGNTIKLPGLRKFLSQHLGFEVERIESFNHLVGSPVVNSPIFQENALCFGVCYGLVLQGLAKSGIYTNLLPPETVRARLIKQKKPWAIAAAASLLLGCGISYGTYSLAMSSVEQGGWKDAQSAAKTVSQKSSDLQSQADAATKAFNETELIGKHLVGNVEGRLRWLELLAAVNEILPRDDATKERPKNLAERNEVIITSMECQRLDDVSTWTAAADPFYFGPEKTKPAGDAGGAPTPTPEVVTPPTDAAATGAAAPAYGPKGPGWIVKLEGHHYHNDEKVSGRDIGSQYVRSHLIDGLMNNKIKLPTADRKGVELVSMKDLGISFPVHWNPQNIIEVPEPTVEPVVEGTPTARNVVGAGAGATSTKKVKRCDFVVMFCWQPKLPSERLAAKLEAEKAVTPETPPASP